MRTATVEEVLTRRRKGGGVQPPVFLVDGRYIVDGASAEGTTRAFQILNWIIGQALEEEG